MNESGDRDNHSPNPDDGASRSSQRNRFLYPQSRYHGEFTPEHLAFNSNLQEFAQRVAIICGLETNGKIAPQDAYDQIKELWSQLETSKTQLLRED